MANVINIATGNYATAATWGVADTTAAKVNGTTATNVTTGNLDSAGYVPGAVTVDGILLNMATRIASPTGTLTVSLENTTDATQVDVVTINVADLPVRVAAVTPGSWHFFEFASSHLLVAGKTYKVRLTSSVDSEVAFYAGASNDWNVLVRTTTTGIANGDRVFIGQRYTGAGAATTVTITMDRNSATAMAAHDISNGGTLTWTTGATSKLDLNDDMRIWQGGTVNVGTSGARIPQGTLATLEFSAANKGILMQGGTFTGYGADKTYYYTLLAADKASGAPGGTTIAVVDSIGANWKNGDVLALASTTATSTQNEQLAMSADGSGTTLTCGNSTYAHSGTSPTQGEVCNLTRSVIIRGTATGRGFLFLNTGTVDLNWTAFTTFGTTTADQKGICTSANAAVSLTMQYCTFYDGGASSSHYVDLATRTLHASATVNIQNNIFYNTAAGSFITLAATTNTSWVISGNIGIRSSSSGFFIQDVGGTFENNRASSGNGSACIYFVENAAIGTFTNNIAHSGAGTNGMQIQATSVTINGATSWRNAGYNILFTVSSGTIQNITSFGGATGNITATTFGSSINPLILDNWTVDAGVTTVAPIGINFTSSGTSYRMKNSAIGGTTTHATADINFTSAVSSPNIRHENVLLGSANDVVGNSFFNTPIDSLVFFGVRSAKNDQVAGAYKTWLELGTIENDTVVFHTAAPSQKLTPNNASTRLESAIKTVPVLSGDAATVSAWVYKNTAGANQPRLIVKKNIAAGITSDTVLDTMTAGATTWEQLSGTTAAVTENCVLEFVVDSDSGNVSVNVDDWTPS